MFTLNTLSRFLDSLEEGVLFLDRGRRVVAINEAATDLLGQDRDEILSRLCPSIFAGTACARACETRGHCTLSQSPPTTTRQLQDISLNRPDGLSVHLRMWSLLLPPNPTGLHCAIILRDRSREVELEGEVRERLRLGGIVGHSPAMQTLYEKILRAATSDATVLVMGESGTGKELVARALHDNSGRSNGPYIAVHCAALPENLLEAELFGHARGAFTGAATARAGRFEAAHDGTLLLDEIGEIPPSIQVKLLRVLQEREIVRLGENHARPVDVRVIAATHRDLAAMVRRGEFREDLYYRLRVLPLEVPALRERREDIAMLATRLLEDVARNYNRSPPQLTHDTILQLEAGDWPGNVRQLANAIEYALVHCDGEHILPRHLPPDIAGDSALSA
ncbi:MAG TPA: sigma 54-interacting transcriptional regulator, partial [Thiohalobacter sp.]|nr:sigma 54-interacting transcriptional regulator [Thiohalobacter sp.]